jgi:hypothetical protein
MTVAVSLRLVDATPKMIVLRDELFDRAKRLAAEGGLLDDPRLGNGPSKVQVPHHASTQSVSRRVRGLRSSVRGKPA